MTVRLALIGAGSIGRRHIATVAATEGVELVAVADPVPPTEASGARLFADAGEMLAGVRPDGVIVATPTTHHRAHAIAALEAGAHVLVEKPIAASLADAEAIVASAATTRQHVLVGHHRRYAAPVAAARDLIRTGRLGRLVAVAGQWTACKDASYFAPGWRRERTAGPVLTNLVHEIDTLRFLMGEIAGLSAETAAFRGHAKEDAAALVLCFVSGALGTLVLSDATPTPWAWEFATGENPALPRSGENACRFMGTEAALDFPRLVLWRHAGGADWGGPIEPEPIDTAPVDPLAAQCAHFRDVIRAEAAPRITAADGVRTLAATLAVFDAAEQGQRVTLPPPPGTRP